MRRILALPAAILVLASCEMRIGNHAPPVAENATAGNRAEEGRMTVEAPGFNLSIDIPEGMAGQGGARSDSGLVYPGARVSGLHIQGGRERRDGEQGEVELRLASSDPPDRVAAWYRDAARAPDFTIASTAREGDATVLSGTGRRDNERFTLRIAPRAGGGTDMRLLLSDRDG